MRLVLALAAVIAGLALVVSEATMRPSPAERWALYGMFAAMALASSLLAWWLVRAHRRLPSLRVTILVVAVAAVATAAAVVGASAVGMFLSTHDLRLVLAALTFGTGLGVLLAVAVAGPLTTDLSRLAEAARRVADGDLDVRTGIDRADEVGALARSLDTMIDQLASLRDERERGEAARRRLLASVSHDLRTPLATLQAAIEALQDDVADDPARYLRSMAGDVGLLRDMVDDLFVLAQLEAGELTLERLALDLAEVVDGAVEAVVPLAAARGVDLRLDADASVPVRGDPTALDRVLRNLLDNAIRHAPAGTPVRVSLSADGVTGTVRVHDDGPGFPAGFEDHAFELFSRADHARERSAGGAGLGLAIAKELVDAHGGAIWIEPGPGARMAFRIPADSSHGQTPPTS